MLLSKVRSNQPFVINLQNFSRVFSVKLGQRLPAVFHKKEKNHKGVYNHCMHGSAMQVVIGHIAFKGEMANFDLSYLRHR
jgi:hypothetical protein